MPTIDSSALRTEVERHGDWITGFEVDGERFGGTYLAEGDDRVALFLDRLRAERFEPTSILECGCLEGGHTSVLAGAWPGATITATDVRPENLERARLLLRVRGRANVRLEIDDLDAPAKAFDARYDAVFCVGLLYHLRWPAAFLERCAAASPRLWLWTVYCAEEAAGIVEGGSRGRLYGEPVAHRLSGVREESFFPTLGGLIEMCLKSGYDRVEVVRTEATKNDNGPAVLLYAWKLPA